MPEDGVGCESFTVISIDSLLVYENKYYLQVYLDNRAYKIVGKKMIDYLHDNVFESDEDYFFLIFIGESYWQKNTIGFLIMGSNFKILFAMVVMI